MNLLSSVNKYKYFCYNRSHPLSLGVAIKNQNKIYSNPEIFWISLVFNVDIHIRGTLTSIQDFRFFLNCCTDVELLILAGNSFHIEVVLETKLRLVTS